MNLRAGNIIVLNDDITFMEYKRLYLEKRRNKVEDKKEEEKEEEKKDEPEPEKDKVEDGDKKKEPTIVEPNKTKTPDMQWLLKKTVERFAKVDHDDL